MGDDTPIKRVERSCDRLVQGGVARGGVPGYGLVDQAQSGPKLLRAAQKHGGVTQGLRDADRAKHVLGKVSIERVSKGRKPRDELGEERVGYDRTQGRGLLCRGELMAME